MRLPMQTWLRRWLRPGYEHKGHRRAYRPVVEGLEDRCLLAAPVVDPINFQPLNVPVSKSLFIPITATDSDGDALSYTVTSSNSLVTVTPRTGTYLKMSVAGF